jgi:hypothetical protein|nr:MAG TPA_asm: neurotoxin [Caudoviricetes sp.]
MAENTNYDELLKKLGLTDEAAIKKWQKEYGLDQTGTWGAAEQAAYDTYGALPYKTEQAIKDYQLSRGIEDTGAWDEATQLAYRGDLAAKGSVSDWSDLAKMVLEGYNLPTTDKDEIKSYVESYLRTAYDQSIENRRKQTEADRAMIDLDAYSRGMGGSTWVTDAKQRLQDSEADDIAKMEANYQAGLNEAVLNQYNQAVAQGLAAQNNAYDLAKDLYSMGQNAKAGVGSMAGSGGGGGGGGYSYRSGKKKSSGSGGGRSGSGNMTYTQWLMNANDGDIFKAAVAAQDSSVKNAARGLGYDNKTVNTVGTVLHDQASGMKRTAQLKNNNSNTKKTSTTTRTSKNKTTSTGSNRRMSGQMM